MAQAAEEGLISQSTLLLILLLYLPLGLCLVAVCGCSIACMLGCCDKKVPQVKLAMQTPGGKQIEFGTPDKPGAGGPPKVQEIPLID